MTDSLDARVGEGVRQYRARLGMTQQQLVDRLEELGWKIHATALTSIEKGKRSLRMEQLELIAKVFEVDPVRVMSYDAILDDGRALDAAHSDAVRSVKVFLDTEEAFAEGLQHRIVTGWRPSAEVRMHLGRWQDLSVESVLHFARSDKPLPIREWDADRYMKRRFNMERRPADGEHHEAP